MSLSIILPCYNPNEEWVKNVLPNFNLVEREIKDAQLIIVNDGSLNLTPQGFASTFNNLANITCITYNENKGKGYALRQGVKVATGELIIYTDIDFPYTNESFLKVYSELQTGNTDIAIGVRREKYYTHLTRTRATLSKLLRSFIKIFLHLPTDDTQCGLKGMNQKGKEVFLQTTINGYLFDLEFIFLAARKKLSIKTIEVELRPEIVLSKMNWKILLQEFGNFLKIFARNFSTSIIK